MTVQYRGPWWVGVILVYIWYSNEEFRGVPIHAGHPTPSCCTKSNNPPMKGPCTSYHNHTTTTIVIIITSRTCSSYYTAACVIEPCNAIVCYGMVCYGMVCYGTVWYRQFMLTSVFVLVTVTNETVPKLELKFFKTAHVKNIVYNSTHGILRYNRADVLLVDESTDRELNQARSKLKPVYTSSEDWQSNAGDLSNQYSTNNNRKYTVYPQTNTTKLYGCPWKYDPCPPRPKCDPGFQSGFPESGCHGLPDRSRHLPDRSENVVDSCSCQPDVFRQVV